MGDRNCRSFPAARRSDLVRIDARLAGNGHHHQRDAALLQLVAEAEDGLLDALAMGAAVGRLDPFRIARVRFQPVGFNEVAQIRPIEEPVVAAEDTLGAGIVQRREEEPLQQGPKLLLEPRLLLQRVLELPKVLRGRLIPEDIGGLHPFVPGQLDAGLRDRHAGDHSQEADHQD